MHKVKTLNTMVHFLVTFVHTNWLQKDLELFLHGKCRYWPPLKLTAPFITQKKILLIIGFMVLKTTGLSSRFQRKNWFLKISTGSKDITKNIPKYEGLVWRPELDTFLLISRDPLQIFKKQFLHWNRERKPVVLSTINPIIGIIFFGLKKDSS